MVIRNQTSAAGIERLGQRQARCVTVPDRLPEGAPAFGVRRLVAAFGHELKGRHRQTRSDSANKLAHSKRWRAARWFLQRATGSLIRALNLYGREAALFSETSMGRDAPLARRLTGGRTRLVGLRPSR